MDVRRNSFVRTAKPHTYNLLINNVVDCVGKSAITDQRQPQGMTLLIAVIALAKRDHGMGLEGIDDCGDGIHRYGPNWQFGLS